MMTQYPAGIVVDIPEPIRSRIQSIRESLGTVTAKLPVEITVAGSSGLGLIPPGTDLPVYDPNKGICVARWRYFDIRPGTD